MYERKDIPLMNPGFYGPWFGVWAMREGYAGHWHRLHDGSHADLETTRTEAERVCAALNEFARTRTDSLGWSYEVRPYAAVSPEKVE